MSAEFWALIVVGVVIWLTLYRINERLAETNRRLQTFWEEWVSPPCN